MHGRFDVKDLGSATTLNAGRLFGQVAQHLGRAIVAGVYRAGDVLPNENGLGGGMSVSRTAYREAVKILTAKGMVEARPKSGTRVAPRDSWNLIDPDVLHWQLSMNPSPQFLRELFELRLIIEPQAARLTALRRSGDQLATLEAAIRKLESEPAYSEASIRADLEFHRVIIASAGNPQLACLAHVVVATLQWSMMLQSSREPVHFKGPLRDHRRIFDAIAAQDGGSAAAMMQVVIADSLNDTLGEMARTAGAAPAI